MIELLKPPFCQTDVVCSTGNYLEFLEKKRHSIGDFGFKPNYIPEIAFDFQKAIALAMTSLFYANISFSQNTWFLYSGQNKNYVLRRWGHDSY